MWFMLHFDKPIVAVEAEIGGTGHIMGRIMGWLIEQNEIPTGVLGIIDDEKQKSAELFLTAEIDDWKLPSLWDKIGHIEKVERLPDDHIGTDPAG